MTGRVRADRCSLGSTSRVIHMVIICDRIEYIASHVRRAGCRTEFEYTVFFCIRRIFMAEKRVMTLRLEPELRRRIDGLAKAQRRSRSFIAAEAIRTSRAEIWSTSLGSAPSAACGPRAFCSWSRRSSSEACWPQGLRRTKTKTIFLAAQQRRSRWLLAPGNDAVREKRAVRRARLLCVRVHLPRKESIPISTGHFAVASISRHEAAGALAPSATTIGDEFLEADATQLSQTFL